MKSTHRPFSPALMGLAGVVAGLCFVVLAFAFVTDMSPREVLYRGVEPLLPSPMEPQEVPLVQLNLTEVTNVNDMTIVPTTTRELADEAYKNTPFRVIKVVESPDALYSYIIATPRAQTGLRPSSSTRLTKMINDEACGSVYTQPVCYLFREGKANVDADPVPTLVAAWSGGAFYPDTAVKFVKTNGTSLMQFTTTDGDAGCSSSFAHQVNLMNKQHTLVKRTDRCVTE